MTLEQTIAGFQQKNHGSFEKIYTMYAENICGVIYTIVGDKERSEELCQDVFVKIWNNAEQYNASKGRFFTWLLNIARNLAIDELRSKNFKNQKKNLGPDFFVGILEEPEDEARTLDDFDLKTILKGLKQKCAQLIEMLYFRGYTQKEAAEEIDVPLGTIKTRNRNCISEIRNKIKA